ncbi:hypothetical protein BDW74DRAFT_182630 [Aspergillus multicolor]|uniref:FAD-dependent oxidoreductase n=1 Tax=Aspergillus multicolor TaxID=41759 RepID=UPI003CCDF0C2
MEMTESLRVIIVGAGVTGLTAAHILAAAGIDHIVVEKWREAAPAAGASITVFPHCARVFKQLGILADIEKHAEPFTDGATNRDATGKVIMTTDLWGYIRENHGTDVMLLERRALLETLYVTLPDKSKVVFNKEVEKIIEQATHIDVFFADGTSERGDLVIGADGVHSAVRQAMWERANSIEPGIITVDEKKSIMATWRCLFGYAPGQPHLKNELSVTSLPGRRCFLVATQPKQTFFFVFWRPDQPYSRYTRPRYTAEDAQRAAESVADIPISESMVFGELWNQRHRAQLADIEEGVLERWHYGRFVLVGDAAHKVTPNLALGGNLGIDGVVHLANLLRGAVQAAAGARPSMADLHRVFGQYQTRHLPRAKAVFEMSRMVTQVQAWDTLMMKYMSLYVAPYSDERAMPNELGKIVRAGPLLDFCPVPEWPRAKMEWDSEGVKTAETGAGRSGLLKSLILGATVAIPLFLWVTA